ncbi:large ribosomal subunit protein mL52-like isoform X2 [Ornithodoros turicata]|uniref:large ribosomal subunit protein mL52-like isoform X2 n=1 Tax=Ornithodoros turicata TaxID=34597 RepID=UPI0031386F73
MEALITARIMNIRQIKDISKFCFRGLHQGRAINIGKRLWRTEHGTPAKWNACRIFADEPDWSFADGRPAPLNVRQKERYLQQIDYCKTVVKMLKELHDAKEAQVGHIKSVLEKKQQIMSGKFRAKGIEALKTQHHAERARS